MKKIKKIFFITILCLSSLVALFGFIKAPKKVNAAAILAAGQTLDTRHKIISISDLTYGDKSGQTEFSENTNTDFSFADFDTTTNPNKNLVFIFKYELNDNSSLSNNNDKFLKIHMDVADDKWDTKNSFVINPDNMLLYDADNSKWRTHETLQQGKTYIIEFGRIAILNSEGNATGTYKVYYKIDGVEVDSVINTYDVSKMGNTMFFVIGSNHSATNKILDAYGQEEAKVIDMSDLTTEEEVLYNSTMEYTFDNTDHKVNYSVIFKFGYTVNELKQNQVHINGKDKWNNASSFILNNGDGKTVHIGKTKADGSDDGWTSATLETPFEVGKTYDIEYGRIANTCGTYLLGTYYCYLKINDEVVATVDCVLNEATVSGNTIFFAGGGKNTFTNVSPADVYEETDVITVSDLYLDGNPVGTAAEFYNSNIYTYNATAAHKSVVFIAKCNIETLRTNETSYIHMIFNNSWINNGIWIRSDKVYISKTDTGYVKSKNAPFTSTGVKELEFGKVYITEGKHIGMYHLYLKIDGVLVVEYFTNTDLNNNYIFSSVGETYKMVLSNSCSVKHSISSSASGQVSTCDNQGMVDYYECSICGLKFVDSEGSKEINEAIHTIGSMVSAVQPTCDTDGNIAYYECSVCHKKYSDSHGRNEITNVVVLKHHTLEKIDAKAETCDEDGNVEYYHCKVCEKNFSDSDASEELNNIVVSKHHTLGELVAEVPTSCSASGVKEHYECSICHKYFSDENGTNEITDLTIEPLPHTTTEDGGCSVCGCNKTPEFKKVYDGSKIVFDGIISWHKSASAIMFESSESSISFDFSTFESNTGITDIITLNGKPVIGNPDNYYRYIITLSNIEPLTPFTGDEVLSILRFRSEGDYANFQIIGAIQMTETPDKISLRDLKDSSGKAIGSSLTLDTQRVYYYSAKAEHKSVVFSFKYEVTKVNENPKIDELSCQFHFSDTWLGSNGGTFWLRDDKNRVSKVSSGYLETDAFSSVGFYDVELGKLYINFGSNSGKYYLYMKIDGELVLDYIIDSMPNKANIFITGTDRNHMYDINSVIDSYEDADLITIRDLKYNGNKMPNIMLLDDLKTYTFNASKEHKSMIFKFKYEVLEMPSKTDYDFGQLHFSNTWTNNAIWLRKDKTYVYKDAEGVCSFDSIFTDTGIKNIEIGKLYIVSGDNQGKYYFYIKAEDVLIGEYITSNDYCNNYVFFTANNGMSLYSYDFVPCFEEHTLGELVSATAPTCDTDGNIAYYWCSNCGKYFASDSVTEISSIIDPKHHTLTTVDKVDETCDTDGNISYYECSSCHKKFSDAEASKELTNDDIVITKHHTLTTVDKVDETCNTDGNISYYECSKCHKKFSDAEASKELTNDDIVIAKHHTLTTVDKVDETCDIDGNISYYECSVCHKKFSDAEATKELTNDEIVITKHHTIGEEVSAVKPTCDQDGSIAYYECSACHKKFSDAKGTHELESIIDPKHHTLEKVERKASNCTQEGNIEYYHCSKCLKNFDEDGNELMDVTTPIHHELEKVNAKQSTCERTGNIEHYHCGVCSKNFDEDGNELMDVAIPVHHELVHHDKVESTCRTYGNIEYWSCSKCFRNFVDAEGLEEAESITIPTQHNLTKVDAKDATCEEDGNIEYYHCNDCDNDFDKNGNKIIDVVIKTKGHQYDDSGVCTICGKDNNKKADNNPVVDILPTNGCKSSLSLVGLLTCLVPLTTIFVIRRKKEER